MVLMIVKMEITNLLNKKCRNKCNKEDKVEITQIE